MMKKGSRIPYTAKRVIAPYVKIVRKGIKPVAEPESKQFTLYLQKKPSVLLRDLTSFLSDSVDLPSLLHESSDVLKVITKASGVSLYLVESATNEIYQSQRYFDLPEPRIRWKIEQGTIMAAHVAFCKEYVMVNDILEDERFPMGIGQNDQLIKSVLCVPIVTPDNDCFAVIELFRDTSSPSFDNNDLDIASLLSGWMGAAIHQNLQRVSMHKKQELNDYLLDLTKCYLEESVSLDKMLREIIKFAVVTMGAERGAFYKFYDDADDKLVDIYEVDNEDNDAKGTHQKITKVKVTERDKAGVIGLVLNTGQTVNIKDAFNDPRFERDVDIKNGFITRSVLCMPVSGSNNIPAIIQVINKKTGCFSRYDELLFNTFAIYSALVLNYTGMDSRLKIREKTNELYLSLLKRQMPACWHEYDYCSKHTKIVKVPPGFSELRWYIPDEFLKTMPVLIFYMFKDLIGDQEINKENLIKFILTAKKFYRDNPFHNFEYAFHVFHAMYIILKRNLSLFTNIEIKALLISALCHALDHSGFSNHYLKVTNDPIFKLYPMESWENYNFWMINFLLDHYPIFPQLTKEHKKLLLKEIRAAIFTMDFKVFLHREHEMKQMLKDDKVDFNDDSRKKLLKILIVALASLCGHCKQYQTNKIIVGAFHDEAFLEGDALKKMGYQPAQMYDRNQDNIAENQLYFINNVVLRCLNIVKVVLPSLQDLHADALILRKTWQDIIELRGRKLWRQEDSYRKKR